MPHPDRSLNLLFDQLDSWFNDITLDEPISQFKLEDGQRKTAPLACRPAATNAVGGNTSNTTNRRNKRNSSSATKQRSSPRSRRQTQKSLDSLAKDLELLLESDDNENEVVQVKEELESYPYKFYADDHIALLDETIGNCCTLNSSINHPTQLRQETKDHALVSHHHRLRTIAGHSQSQHDPMLGTKPSTKCMNYSTNNITMKNSIPRDHDYTSMKLRTKPLVSKNDLARKTEYSLRKNSRETASVLNIGALSRFAKFSDKFRLLAKHVEA